MARIKIMDLPDNTELSLKDLRRIRGGNLDFYYTVALDRKGGDRPVFKPVPLLPRLEYFGKISGPNPKLY